MWFRVAVRLLLALLALAAIIGKVAVEQTWIPPNPILEAWTLIVAGAIVFVDSVIGLARDLRRRSIESNDLRVKKAVTAAQWTISKETGVDLALIGGSVFLTKRTRPRSETKLRRIARERISDSPQQSAVKWTTGKGAIGRALKERRTVHVDWTRIAQRHSGEISEKAFDALPAATRAGLAFDEFRSIVDKYAEILAVPIFVGEKCVGVLAIDVPMTVEHSGLGTCLNPQAVREIAESCAAVLSDVLRNR